MVEEMFKKILMRIRGFLNQPIEKQLMVLILIVFLIFLLTLTQYVSVLTESVTRTLYTP
jgi:flagellar biosynthesis/type III secretory pathway M-ring protein FliF/YscJ